MSEKKELSLASKLRMLRAENGISQAEVAAALGISQQTYSKYESLSKPVTIDSKLIVKICEYYGVSSDFLLGIKERPQAEVTKTSASPDVDLIVRQVLTKLENKEEKK